MPVLVDENELLESFGIASSSEDDSLPSRPYKRQKVEEDDDKVHNEQDPSNRSALDSSGDDELQFDEYPITSPAFDIEPSKIVQIRPSQLTFPKSLYDGSVPHLPPTHEGVALQDLLDKYAQLNLSEPSADHDIMFTLSDFRIYRPPADPDRKNHVLEFEMEPLQRLKMPGCDSLLFDGIISVGDERRYVEGVYFETLAIEGYGDTSIHSVAGNLSIQSPRAAGRRVWYLLSEPSSEYERYHKTFLWIADLAKHVGDFMAHQDEVALRHFRTDFYSWLEAQHGQEESFQDWLSKFGRSDFRTAIVANSEYLWNQLYDVIKDCGREPLWEDMHFFRDNARKDEAPGKTVVTPFVYHNFKHMPFVSLLDIQQPTDPRIIADVEERKSQLGFVDAVHAQRIAGVRSIDKRKLAGRVKAGDFVAVEPDEESGWKDGEELWYAYVQYVRKDRLGEYFHVIWMYSPSGTTLTTGVYSYPNELFFSDHCNCDCKDTRLRAEDIVCKIKVKWLRNQIQPANPAKRAVENFDYFIRQKYNTDEHSFMTLKDSDFRCRCDRWRSDLEEVMSTHTVGDTVLIPFDRAGQPLEKPPAKHDVLEPVVIVSFMLETERMLVRRLLRKGRDFKDLHAKPNELVWTNEILEISASIVGPKCYIRFYQEEYISSGRIPTPYDRSGTGNCWYITTEVKHQRGLPMLEKLRPPFPDTLNQGWDPSSPPPRARMPAMDMFCGGGNFGRGLAEGGAIDCVWALDWNKSAVHTYRANEAQKTRVYWGSVNDYLAQAIQGSQLEHIARFGDVDFIAAGSPCQGFSGLQRYRMSERSLRNISMVTAVAAYIDLYRPKYALLENVVAMTHKGEGRFAVFPQLLCTLVGMGYQVQQFNKDAWTTGDCQRRSRLFIVITAPGLTQLSDPVLTHSHPPGLLTSSLGKNANNVHFGQRRFGPTPFRFVSAQEAMQDLPHIGDSRVQSCIPFPDHRTCTTKSARVRSMIQHIPTFPPGKTLVNTIEQGLMPQPITEWFAKRGLLRNSKNSKSWSRIRGEGLIPTITTVPSAADAMVGRLLHWREPRLITILEVRRAQGFPDHEVIIGTPNEQWKIIGNSVARGVALGLGMALREAWLANPLESTTPLSVRSTQRIDPPGTQSNAYVARDPSADDLEALPAAAPTPVTKRELRVTNSVSIRKRSTSNQTRTSLRTRDTLEISAKTTIQQTTVVPLQNGVSSSSSVVAIDLTGDDEEDELATPKSLASASRGVVRTRAGGEGTIFSPRDWSKIPGRLYKKRTD